MKGFFVFVVLVISLLHANEGAEKRGDHVFDCNTYSSCTQCVSSSFPCDWCIDGHRCTHDTAINCRNDILVTGISKTIPSYRSGPGFCPRINATVGISPEILVASGTKKAIKVKVHIIGQFIVQTRFVCQFNIEGRITSVNAQLLGDTIYCDAMDFFYTSGAPNITVPFAVIWGGSKPIDNPDNVHIVIYRCRKMADNCGNCLALAKKYNCGWCQSSDRCEVKDQCENISDVWLNWSQTCPNPKDTSFNPKVESNNLNTNLNLVNDNLLIINATKDDSGVNCTTPRTDSLPSIPPVQNHVFDCNTYSSCTQCVSSSFPCDWCMDGHRCTHDTAENCRNDILVTGVSRTIPSYRSGPGFCPRINATVGISPEILVASGTKKAIKVKVHIIGQFIVQTRFVCQFNIEGRITSVNAQLLGDTIYCDVMEFFYTSGASNITVPFAVIWGGSKPLDNPDNVHIVIYRCRKMADSCGNCLALAKKYNCGWCQSSDRCEVKDQCENRSDVWLNWSQSCPNPEDTSFSLESNNLNINLNLVNDNLSIKNTTKNDSGVNCTTPSIDSLPSIPPVQNHVFDCNTYSSCTQCVSSSFPCDWCVDRHRCTHDTAENCRNDILVTGVSRTIPSYRSGPGFCPRINARIGISPKILIASGTKKAIKVKVHIIGQFIVQTRFVCQFNIEGKITSVNAQLLGDTIYCDAMEFFYTSRAPNITVPFAVIWGGSKPLDNPDNVHIVIYRCRKMADNCGNCLTLANKYNCGWCQSFDRCEVKDQCENRSGVWLNWNQTCPNPEDTSFSSELNSDNLNINLNLVNDNLSITNATENDSGVNCTTPKTDSLSSIPPVQNHVFDCNTYSSCTQCVSSSFPCDWCIDGHRCTHDTAENCRNDILVTGVSKTIPSYRSGPGFCPRINATVGISPEILVASGTKKAIKVKVHIIGQFIVQTRFVCQFNIEGRITSVNAQLLGDTIYCDVIEFSYTSNTPNITVPFAVIWGGSKPLDNPDNIHIVIYRCHKMADNCGNCLVLANKYNCGWCQSSDRCEVKDQCENGSGVWLNWNQTCSNPKDTSFSPEVKSDNLNINLNLVNDNL